MSDEPNTSGQIDLPGNSPDDSPGNTRLDRETDAHNDHRDDQTEERDLRVGSAPTRETVPEPFHQLAIAVPPMLEAAIRYEGDARFVAFYWGGGDEAYYDDGRMSGTGEWSAYLCFVQQRAVWPALVGYDFGSSDAPAQHYLVLDRQTRTLYAAPERAARQFLGRQWPQPTAEEAAALAQLDLDAINAQLQTVVDELHIQETRLSASEREAAVLAMMAAAQQRTAELLHWLDAQPDDGRAAALMDEMLRHLDEATREGKPFDGTPPF